MGAQRQAGKELVGEAYTGASAPPRSRGGPDLLVLPGHPNLADIYPWIHGLVAFGWKDHFLGDRRPSLLLAGLRQTEARHMARRETCPRAGPSSIWRRTNREQTSKTKTAFRRRPRSRRRRHKRGGLPTS